MRWNNYILEIGVLCFSINNFDNANWLVEKLAVENNCCCAKMRYTLIGNTSSSDFQIFPILCIWYVWPIQGIRHIFILERPDNGICRKYISHCFWITGSGSRKWISRNIFHRLLSYLKLNLSPCMYLGSWDFVAICTRSYFFCLFMRW